MGRRDSGIWLGSRRWRLRLYLVLTSHLFARLSIDNIEREVYTHALEVALRVEVIALHPRREVRPPVLVDARHKLLALGEINVVK